MRNRWWVLGTLILGSLFIFQNCSKGGLSTPGQSYSSNFTFQLAPPACYFDGKPLRAGETVLAYLYSTPDSTYGCVSENRTCLENGMMTGSYAFASCVQGPRACLFNGITVRSGDSVRAYQVATAGNCQEETRTCQDGRLSGTYTFAACSSTNCIFGGRTYASGESVNYFSSATVPASQDCQPQVGVCQNAVLKNSSGAPLPLNQIFPTCERVRAQCLRRDDSPLNEGDRFEYNTMGIASGVNFCPPQRAGYCDRLGQLRDTATDAVLDRNSISRSCLPETGHCQPGPSNSQCPTGVNLLLVPDMATQLCADVLHANPSLGQPLIIWDCHQQANQRFQIFDNYEMRAYGTAFCLEPSGASVVISQCNGSPSQKWAFNSSTRQIRNGNGQCLLAPQRGAGLVLGACDSSAANQKWGFSRAPDDPPPNDGGGGGIGGAGD